MGGPVEIGGRDLENTETVDDFESCSCLDDALWGVAITHLLLWLNENLKNTQLCLYKNKRLNMLTQSD